MIVDADVVQHPAQAAQGDAHAVGPAEAAELPAALQMRLQVEEHAGNAAPVQLLLQRGERGGEVAAESPRGRCRPCRPARSASAWPRRCTTFCPDRAGMAIVLDVHPAHGRLHRQILLVNFAGVKPWQTMLPPSKTSTMAGWFTWRWISARIWPVLPTRFGFDLEAERQVGAVAHFGDLPQLVDRLRNVLLRIAPLRRIERKTADQLGLEGVGQLAGLLHVLLQIFLERHVGVLRAVLDVEQLDLADRRADRRDVQAIFVFQVADLL